MKKSIAILSILVTVGGLGLSLPKADQGTGQSEVFRNQVSTPISNQVSNQPSSPHNSIDPFIAGALGFVPYFSGYYITKTPERGLVFSLVDVLLTLGIYTSLHSKSGDPDHVPVYYTFMGVNNIVDAYFSAHEAMKSSVRPQVKLRPHGGVEYSVAWIF